jgi:NitT/TauT family transport system ATP-binding protein
VARSLVLDPDLLLMDEPFSSLDALTRESLQEELLVLIRETGLTLLIVTHSIEEAVLLGQRIVVLSNRPGRVRAVIENCDWGGPGYRGTRQFFARCAQLRSLLSHNNRGEAANDS